jgi:hypothetical protein
LRASQPSVCSFIAHLGRSSFSRSPRLRRCGKDNWAALGRDTKIVERPDEIEDFRRAKIHIFLYPGTATLAELVDAAAETLVDVCACSSRAGGGA